MLIKNKRRFSERILISGRPDIRIDVRIVQNLAGRNLVNEPPGICRDRLVSGEFLVLTFTKKRFLLTTEIVPREALAVKLLAALLINVIEESIA